MKAGGEYSPKDREFVKRHFGLILAVDALVCDQTSSSDHVRGHTITNESEIMSTETQWYADEWSSLQNDVLGLAGSLEVTNLPGSNSGVTAIVRQGGCVDTRRRQINASVSLCRYVYNRGGTGILGKKILFRLVSFSNADAWDLCL